MRTNTTLSPATAEFYQSTVSAVFQMLDRLECPSMPRMIKEEDVRKLMDHMAESSYAVVTRKGYVHALSQYAAFYGNNVIQNMKIRWPYDSRPNVDWLTAAEIRQLLGCSKNPVQEFGIHCMLQLGMRRIEILRMKPGDIHSGYITVWGKGPQGGKPRNIPFHPATSNVLTHFNAYRKELIETATKSRPATTEIPDRYVINLRGGTLRAFDEDGWGWDKAVVVPLREALGFHFSNHTLRRTFGRMMYRANVPIATISKILGHEDMTVTLRYIGVDIDDMQAAMNMCPF